MRDSLTVLAILLIGVLTAALVGPYLIDWNSQRALIEHRLTQAAGTPVTVAGPIDVKLLPTPRFRFGDVTVGDGRAARPRLTAEALEAEISLTAIMRGQVQIVDTTLISPHLDLSQGPDGTFDWPALSDATADRIAVDHLGVRDGTLTLKLADGRRETLAGLDLDGGATSLRGPLKIDGRLGGIPFRLATGAFDQGRMRVKLHVDAAAPRPAVDVDGTVARRPGSSGLGWDGTAVAVGALSLDGSPATVPWSLTAHLSADLETATASEVELRAGADMRALIARGEGTATYAAAATPSAALRVHGGDLDLDSLAVSPPDGSIAPPKGSDLVRSLVHGLGLAEGAGSVSLPLHLHLALGFDTAVLSGRTLLGLEAKLGLGPEPTAAVMLSAQGPQGASLVLDGRFDPGPVRAVAGVFGAAPAGPAATFRGRTEIRSSDLGRTATWLAPLAPDLASALAGVPGRSLHVVAGVEASDAALVARDAVLDLDGSRLKGLLSFNRSVGADRARLFADLTSDTLVVDRVPSLSSLVAATPGLDLDLALAAQSVTLAGSAPLLGLAHPGPVAAGHLALRLTRSGDDLKLTRLSFDVDGASVEGTAERSDTEARADLHLSVPQLGPLSGLWDNLIPPAQAALLKGHAAALSPFEATLKAEAATPDPGGAMIPVRMAFAGTAGGTHFDADVTPGADTATNTGDLRNRPLVVSVKVDAPAAADLMRQFDLPVAGVDLGPARLNGQARGTLADGFALNVTGMLGVAALDFQGQARSSQGSGHLTLRSTGISPLVTGFVGPVVPTDVSAEVRADVGWDGTQAEFRDISAKVGDAQATGSLALDLQPKRDPAGTPIPSLRGSLALNHLSASALFGLAFGASADPAADAVWSSARFATPATPLPSSRLAIRSGDMALRNGLKAQDVAFDLSTRGGALVLSNAMGRLGDGRIGGTLTLRRDPAGNSLSGQIVWNDVTLDAGGLTGKVSGSQAFSGTGASPAALVSGLAGSGSLTLHDVLLARTDPTAPARTYASIVARDRAAERNSGGTDVTPTDPDAILSDLSAQLDNAPMRLSDAGVATMLAGGVLRVGPVKTSGSVPIPSRGSAAAASVPWAAEETATLDLNTLKLDTRADLQGPVAGRSEQGGGALITRSAKLGSEPSRSIDASSLVAAVQAQAIARAQERIDVLEQDIRERAAFNRQLKAIQAAQQAEKERAEAERRAAAAQAAADAKARSDAAQAAAEAQRAAALRQKAEDARIQAQIESSARASAAAAGEAEKQRFIDKALKASEPPLDSGGSGAPLRAPERREPRSGDTAPSDPSTTNIMR